MSSPIRSIETSRTAPDDAPIHRNVPWQIWIVVTFLAVEGIGNVLAIPQNSAALVWLIAKCLFIVGLIRAWRFVFVLFLIVTAQHVLAFSGPAPFIAVLNLVLVILAGSAFRYFFPNRSVE